MSEEKNAVIMVPFF